MLRTEETPKTKIRLVDCKLAVNLAIVPQNIPRSLTQPLPYLHMDLLSWSGQSGKKETTSGPYHLRNTPNRMVLFFTKENLDDQLVNPYNFKHENIAEVEVYLNGMRHEASFQTDKDLGA